MNSTLKYLQNVYGPLMSLEALAKTLDRSPQGLRVSLNTKSDISMAINSTKRKIGRRVYFRTEGIAKMIDGENQE
jgi:hypothetical protein